MRKTLHKHIASLRRTNKAKQTASRWDLGRKSNRNPSTTGANNRENQDNWNETQSYPRAGRGNWWDL
jgi:hypothetical protein